MGTYYSMMMKLKGRKCTVVGGGEVAERKVKSLLQQGGIVKVISPHITTSLENLWQQGKITYINRDYKTGDLKDSFLVYATTNDAEVNGRCKEEAYKNNTLINIADDPEASDFTVPASIKRGSLIITISTEGKSPMLSKKIRQQLEALYPEEYEEILNILGEIRRRTLREISSIAARKKLFYTLVYDIPIEGRAIEDIRQEMWKVFKTFKALETKK
ncbi:MAG: bifunctional precorrin-2 dehydrogenase/sirohydrochlorin ferrochelatase [Clostridiaceae bacterium]|nr:bifunctional precorrin-2 dehydrogenase/sirohydrochlorin ferrochelatase [Clostridiaceae bacterium]